MSTMLEGSLGLHRLTSRGLRLIFGLEESRGLLAGELRGLEVLKSEDGGLERL